MAARIKKYHTDEIRQKIKTSQLVNLLTSVALTGRDAAGQEVGTVRIEAAKTLLRKVMPDLTSTELSGDVVSRQYVVSGEPPTADEWSSKYSGGLGPPAGTTESIN